MSARSISFGTTCGSRSEASWLGAIEGSRVWAFGACAPVWWSSSPASAPCSCAASVIRRSARMSSSSQNRAAISGASSDSGENGAYSVLTAAQPPSALTPRCAACVQGFSVPNPEQWGT